MGIRYTVVTTLLASSLILGWSGKAQCADALGLDAYKKSAESLTSKAPYKTRFNNTIHVYAVPAASQTKGQTPLRYLVNGGLHGNELLGSEFVAWLTKKFASGESLLNKLNGGNVEIDFVPYSNPDGTLFYSRVNGNKINLNRNFGVLWGVTKENPGTSAFSEVETKALRDLIATRNYTGAVDVHGYINWIVVPTSPTDGVKGLPRDRGLSVENYNKWTSAIRRETQLLLPGYEVKTAGGLGDGGSFEDYTWWQAQVPAFCLEVFQDKRFVLAKMASKLVELITPKFITHNHPDQTNVDTFLVYERFIYTMFDEAAQLRTKPAGKAGRDFAYAPKAQ